MQVREYLQQETPISRDAMLLSKALREKRRDMLRQDKAVGAWVSKAVKVRHDDEPMFMVPKQAFVELDRLFELLQEYDAMSIRLTRFGLEGWERAVKFLETQAKEG